MLYVFLREHTSERCFSQTILLKERDWVGEPSLQVCKRLMVEVFASVPFTPDEKISDRRREVRGGRVQPPSPFLHSGASSVQLNAASS